MHEMHVDTLWTYVDAAEHCMLQGKAFGLQLTSCSTSILQMKMLMISSTCAAKEAKEAKCCSRCTCHIAMDNFSSVQRIKIIEFLWLRLVLRLSHWIVLKREMQREMQTVKCNACRRYEFRQACRKAGLTFRDAEEAGGQPGLVHLMVKHDESQNFKSRWGNGISMNFRSKI